MSHPTASPQRKTLSLYGPCCCLLFICLTILSHICIWLDIILFILNKKTVMQFYSSGICFFLLNVMFLRFIYVVVLRGSSVINFLCCIIFHCGNIQCIISRWLLYGLFAILNCYDQPVMIWTFQYSCGICMQEFILEIMYINVGLYIYAYV